MNVYKFMFYVVYVAKDKLNRTFYSRSCILDPEQEKQSDCFPQSAWQSM